MDNICKTIDRGFQNDLLTIQSSSIQNFSTIPEGFQPNCSNQPDSAMLIDDNGLQISPGPGNLPTYTSDAIQIYSAGTIESQNNVPPIIFTQQADITRSKKIQIKFDVRSEYHPRTAKENEEVAHYIRCEQNEEVDYPTVYTICTWQGQGKCNYIEVALVDIFGQPHPYTISNKEIFSNKGAPLVPRAKDMAPNRLYFLVTDEDFENGCKTFKIQITKSKQNKNITKNFIRERQLEKSMFCFTRTFYDEYGVYRRDEDSTAYSCVMTEKYGNIRVDCINPKFGPLGGNQLLTIVFTGLKPQDRKKLSFEILAPQTPGWNYKIKEFTSVGNAIYFPMPDFPHTSDDRIMTSVIVYYEGEAIDESPFLYIPELDPILNDFNLNEPKQIDANSTTSNNKSGLNHDSADSSCSSSTISKKSIKKNSKKRPHED